MGITNLTNTAPIDAWRRVQEHQKQAMNVMNRLASGSKLEPERRFYDPSQRFLALNLRATIEAINAEHSAASSKSPEISNEAKAEESVTRSKSSEAFDFMA